MSTPKIEIENFDYTGLILKEPKEKAVGIPAIISSVKHMAKYMDPIDAFKLSLKINQKGGFDCPGCAWPDPDDDRSAIGEYCENGIKAIAEEATKKSLTADYFANHSVAEISKLSDFEIGKLGRLTEPMILKNGATHYEPIQWKDAFSLIAKELNALATPDDAIFYTSGRTSNEAAYLYQLLKQYNFTEWDNVYTLLTAQSGKQVFSKTNTLLKDRAYLFLFKNSVSKDVKTIFITFFNTKFQNIQSCNHKFCGLRSHTSSGISVNIFPFICDHKRAFCNQKKENK